MPEKNPDVWAIIWAWLVSVWALNSSQIGGFMAGVVVAYFRALYFGKDGTKAKRFAEAVVCGTIAATCQPVLEYIGIGERFLPFVGTALGLLGLDFLMNKTKNIASRWLTRKTGDDDNAESE